MAMLELSGGVWFYARDRQKYGPFSWEQLRDLAGAGELRPEDMVLKQGAPRWFAAREIDGLFVLSSTDILEQGNTVSLAASALESPTVSATEPRIEPASDSPAAVNVSGYEVLEELGRGGMGVVYKARQKGLKRLVALKMILDSTLAGPGERERFRLEAESIAHLHHPNIVQIYEVGESDGRPFFSLEYVDGGTLKDHLAGIPLRPTEAAQLAETLARAVAYAHQQGIIHRDLKPANVLLASGVSNDPGSITAASILAPLASPKIADFGLAKQLGDDSGQTSIGAIMGTPSYMAPEQALGQTDAVGPLSDVYSLGAILYETLSGRPPFRAASILETLEQVRTREPVPPAQLQPGVPRDLDTICLKCLHKDPGKRYASALALADDLHRFLEGRPILARPLGPAARVIRWGRRNPAVASLLGVLVVVIVAGFSLVTWKWREALDLAERETEARGQEEKAKVQAHQDSNEARRRSAVLLLERALTAARENEIQQALFWLTDGLAEAIKAEDAELEHALRLQIGAWSQSLPVRTGYLPFKDVRQLTWSQDGKVVLASLRVKVIEDTIQHWDARAGRPLGPPIHHDFLISLIALSPDGSVSLTAADNGFNVRDAHTGNLLYFKQFRGQHITAAAFSSSNKLLMIGTLEGKSQCYDALTGEEVGPLLSQGSPVKIIVFSPATTRVVTGGSMNYSEGPSTFQVWEVPSFKPVGKPITAPQDLRAVAFSPDGRTILTGYREGKVQFWSTLTATALGGDIVHPNRFQTFSLHPGGRYLATGGTGMKQHLLAPGSAGGLPGEPARIFFPPTQTDALAYSPDGRVVLAAGAGVNHDGGQIRLWRTGSNLQLGPSLFLPHPIQQAGFLAEGRMLVARMVQGDVALWQRVPEILIGQADFNEEAHSLVSPDGQRALIRKQKEVCLWDMRSGRPIGTSFQPVTGHSLALSLDGRCFAFNPDAVEVTLIRVEGERFSRHVLVHPSRSTDPEERLVETMEFSHDGRLLATASVDGVVQLWDVGSARALGKPLEHEGIVGRLVFSPDGRVLFVDRSSKAAFKDPTRGVQLWNLATQTAGPCLDVPKHCRVVFSPDGKTLYIGAYEGEILACNVITGQPVRPGIRLSSKVQALALSGDGKVLLAGCSDGTARAWNTDTWKPLSRVLRNDKTVVAVALSHDGRLGLTGALNHTARLWDVQQGRPLGAPILMNAFGVEFSSDDKRILLAGRDGVIRVQPVPVPVEGNVERVRRWLEVTTGTEMDEHDALRPLERKTWEARNRELLAEPKEAP